MRVARMPMRLRLSLRYWAPIRVLNSRVATMCLHCLLHGNGGGCVVRVPESGIRGFAVSFVSTDPQRLLYAALLMGMYLGSCAQVVSRHRRHQTLARNVTSANRESADCGITNYFAYASQTGVAEQVAREAAHCLRGAGHYARLLPLDQLDLNGIEASARVFFVLSTCGEGDAPDNGALFPSVLRSAETKSSTAVAGLRYSVLALGDRAYRNFCGFGRSVDAMLLAGGAVPLFSRIDVDRADPKVLEDWLGAVMLEAGCVGLTPASSIRASKTADEIANVYGPAGAQEWAEWQLLERQHLNPGSL